MFANDFATVPIVMLTIVRVAKSGEYAIEVDVIQLVRIGDSLAVDVAPYCRRWSPMYFVLGVAVIESIIASIGGKNLVLSVTFFDAYRYEL